MFTKKTLLALAPSVIASLMVVIGGLLTYQYGRYSQVTDRKIDAYSNLLSEVMYFAPNAVVEEYPDTINGCQTELKQARLPNRAAELSDEEWKVALPRIDKALGRAYVLADEPLRRNLNILRGNVRDQLALRRNVAVIKLAGAPISSDAIPAMSNKTLSTSVVKICETIVPQMREAKKKREELLAAIRNEIGL